MRALRYLIFILGGIFVAVALFITLMWFYPGVVFNGPVLRAVASLAEARGLHLKWKSQQIEVKSVSFWRKRIEIDLTDFCFNNAQAAFSGCGQNLSVAFSVAFPNFTPKLDLKHIEPEFLRIVDLKWKKTSSQASEPTLTGVLNVQTIEKSGSEVRPKPELAFRFLGDVRGGFDFHFNLVVRPDDHRKGELGAAFDLKAGFQQKRTKILARLEGRADTHGVSASVQGEARRLLPEIPFLRMEDCSLDWGWKDSSSSLAKLQCSSHLALDYTPRSRFKLQLPFEFKTRLEAHARFSDRFPSARSQVEGKLSLEGVPAQPRDIKSKVVLDSKVIGRLSEPFLNWQIRNQIKLTVSVPQIENLISRAKSTPWAVPAPLAVLKGPAQFEVQGQSDLKFGEFPFVLVTRLKSASQKMELDGKGLFRASLKQGPESLEFMPEVDFDLTLSRLVLELPDLELKLPPQLIRDRRFSRNHEIYEIREGRKKSLENNQAKLFRYRIRIHTPPETSAMILSNLIQKPIPIQLDLKISDSTPLAGSLKIDGFKTRLFGRKAELEYLDFNLREPLSSSEVKGAARVDYADYQIFLTVRSSLDKPVFRFRSTPPLSENDVLATLLYGQPLDELDTEQASSIGNVRSAFADRAIRLASLYILASTPVQSVGYDPASRSLTAKVKLGEGMSLNLGKDFGESAVKVGIQKRLGKAWTVRTEFKNSASNGEVASTYLEWSLRY